jgi:arylsulfate sulfotransferase
MEQQTTVGSWAICDYWYPDNNVHGGDWSHLNTIEPFPDEEETFLLSSRNQHTLFKFDVPNDEIEWRLGGKGEFGLARDNLFLRQHDPEILPNGNIIIFDNGDPNGNDDADEFDRQWSRAVEVSYDTESMTAEVVWEFRPDPDVFTPIWGDADRLDNGNTLVTFGHRNTDDTRNSRIMEATASSQKVWDLEAPNKWGWYRADRVNDPPAGYMIGE